MRILYVARRYWPAVGGVESFLRHMACELGTRHEVTVLAARIDDGEHTRLNDSVCPPPGFRAFRDGSAPVKPLEVPLIRRLAMTPLLTQVTPGLRRYAYGRSRVAAAALLARAVAPIIAAEARGADVIHMWAGDLLASAAVRAGALASVPVVITPFAHEGQWGYDPASVRAYRSADKVLALLATEADFYRRLGIEDSALAVTGVCSPGVPAVDRDVARRRLGVTGPLVLFLGARRPYKGIDLLLEAAPAVTAQLPATSFAFVGPGSKIERTSMGSKTIDVGPVDDVEKAMWLTAADVLCLPSAAEILPVSILEAWSAGTPVLTSGIPPLRELVCGADGGRCCDRDAGAIAANLITMLTDQASLRSMGDRGRAAWEQRYTPARVAERHERMYAEAAARASCPCR